MSFNTQGVTQGIHGLRTLWNKGMTIESESSVNLGRIGYQKSFTQPYIAHNRRKEPTSAHEKLADGAWKVEILQQCMVLDGALRSIPALDAPNFDWEIVFKFSPPTETIARPLPAFELSIKHAALTKSFVETTTTTLKRLYEIQDQLSCVPKPSGSRTFWIKEQDWQADTPENALRLYAALHRPELMIRKPGADYPDLPDIFETFDKRALQKALWPD